MGKNELAARPEADIKEPIMIVLRRIEPQRNMRRFYASPRSRT
jgi:hypothetical protein